MELLVFVGGLAILDVLALRYGYDSRDGITSDESHRRTTWLDETSQRRHRLGGALSMHWPHAVGSSLLPLQAATAARVDRGTGE
jgi:hypothetical protein